MPALAERVSSGKASETFPRSLSRTARRNAASGEARPISRSRTSIRSPGSRLAHALLGERHHAAEQIAEDGALADLDVGGDRHAGDHAKPPRHIVQPDFVDRDAGPVERLGAGLRYWHRARRVARLVLRGEAVRADDP